MKTKAMNRRELEYIPLDQEVTIPAPLMRRLRAWWQDEFHLRLRRCKRKRERVIRF